jgi:hypothetical protein
MSKYTNFKELEVIQILAFTNTSMLSSLLHTGKMVPICFKVIQKGMKLGLSLLKAQRFRVFENRVRRWI